MRYIPEVYSHSFEISAKELKHKSHFFINKEEIVIVKIKTVTVIDD